MTQIQTCVPIGTFRKVDLLNWFNREELRYFAEQSEVPKGRTKEQTLDNLIEGNVYIDIKLELPKKRKKK